LGGPFRSAKEYYQAWSMSKQGRPECGSRPNPNFPKRVAQIAHLISSQNSGPFALFHTDFGNHNILVDDEYNIVGVIDWIDAHVLPMEFCAIYPHCLYELPEVFWVGSPMETINREGSKEKDELRRFYLDEVRKVEQEKGYEQRLSALLGSYNSEIALCLGLYSDGNRNPLEKLLDEKYREEALDL